MNQKVNTPKSRYAVFCTALLCTSLCLPSMFSLAQGSHSNPVVIPAPAAVSHRTGEFVLTRHTPLYSDAQFRDAADVLSDLLGKPWLEPLPGATSVHDIRLTYDTAITSPEAYRLNIQESGIRIHARGASGAYYAAQTLRQLLPASVESGSRFRAYRLPCIEIVDAPRFQWRGVMLDCSRHFLPVSGVKSILDRMAALKLNRLHWHLTDDQGWRLEIRAYPELTRVGAWRGEGATRHGGFYTQEDVRDIVAYATQRHIVVVPEIEMPGHCTAALASYPSLGCSGDSIPVQTEFGMFETVMCPGREETYTFITGVLAEVAELFPGQWVHIGGDECPMNNWKTCAACKERAQREGLPSTDRLQMYFTGRIESILDTLGKTTMGWHEIMDGASKKSLLQAWSSVDNAFNVAKQGFKVVSSPPEPLYLNYSHEYNTLKRVYSFDPLQGRTWPDNGSALLGIECCLWAESLPTPSDTFRKLFPRIAAVAEVAWTSPVNKNWESFRQRIGVLGGRWVQQGQEFFPLEEVSWDDGRSLHVSSLDVDSVGVAQIEFNGPAGGDPLMTFGSIPWIPEVHGSAPIPLHRDDVSMTIEYARTSPRILPECALRGLFKRGNAWAELIDSTSADGLYYFPRSLAQSSIALECYPNPILLMGGSANLSLLVTLPEPESFELLLRDVTGRCILRQEIAASYFGTHTLRMDLGNLSSGLYNLQLRAGGTSASTMVHVVR